jgi:hypothetical protein
MDINLVRAGLMARSQDWERSSYPGYFGATRRRVWVGHQALLDTWRGEHGGDDPAAAKLPAGWDPRQQTGRVRGPGARPGPPRPLEFSGILRTQAWQIRTNPVLRRGIIL